jgi:tetratricopeptide (TPR) repeat protein
MTSGAEQGMTARRLGLVPGLADEFRVALADGERALHTDGDLRASRQSFEIAYQLAELASDAQAMAIAALGLAGLWVSERRTVTGTVMLETRLQHVLSLLDERSVLALRIRARLAGEADYRRGEHAAILAVLDEARAVADPVLLAETLSLAHHCSLGPDDVALRRDLAVELISVSFLTKRRSDWLMGLMWQTVDSYSQGHPHAARFLAELREQLSLHDHPAVAYVVSAIEVMLAIRSGRLDEAESLVSNCAEAGAAAGDVDNEWWPAGQLATIRWYQGRLPELLPLLRDRVGSPALSAVDNSALMALALAAAQSGDGHTAASCLATLRNGNLADLPKSSSWLATMNGIVQAAYLINDVALASEAYQLLLPYAYLPVIGGLAITCFGSVKQGLGVACLTSGNLDLAVEHLDAAVQHNLALGHWPAVVSSRRHLAEAYERRGQAGDVQAAQRSLSTAASESKALHIPGGQGRTAETDSADEAQCERIGRQWRIAWRDRAAIVSDSVGMLHLAVLIANPRQDIPAVDLVTGLAGLGGAVGEGAGQPLLDQEALAEYRRRLALLDDELANLESSADPEQVRRAQAERDWLIAQLASATGLAGRTRSFPDESERARVAVGKAIRRALARIAHADAVIGEHLRQTVRTGTRCSYWPS